MLKILRGCFYVIMDITVHFEFFSIYKILKIL